ncbi:putative G-protein coupled receptor 160 [Scleropages formosus]|nr:probable G-protein coupled receptor 160 [Scleropages formosus]XP_029106462.1 probable G-protein coupled receptor 160 [Scleropages formosus]
MRVPLSSLLLVLIGKCSLNWTVVVIQRRHMGSSLLGFLCISLALVDSFLAFILSTIYFLQDVHVFGLRITTHHICLLVQIACFTYSLLHWPVFVLIGLDHGWNLALHPVPLRWYRKLGYTLSVILIWAAAVLYVFLASDLYPEVGEEFYLLIEQCWVFSSPQSTQVFMVSLLALACAVLHSSLVFLARTAKGGEPPAVGLSVHAGPLSVAPKAHPSSRFMLHTTLSFLSTWVPFVVLQTILLLFQVDTPAYVDLNVPWLCFLNSFAIGAVLWRRSQLPGFEKDSTFTDGFCQWDFSSEFADVDNCNTEQLNCDILVYKGEVLL